MKREKWLIEPNWSPEEPTAPTPTDPPAPDPSLATGGDPHPATPAPTPEGEEPPVAPEPLTMETLAVPEGMELDETTASKFLEVMNDGEMSAQDRANALLGLQAEVMKAASEQSSALWQKTQDDWKKEVMEDPEFGGEKLNENLASIRRLVDEYGSKELEDLMDMTGVGNNIHMLRFAAKLAKAFEEGKPLSGEPTSAPRDPAEVLYPKQRS